MPNLPKKACTFPGCPELTDGGPCEKHRREAARRYDEERGSAAKRGYDRRWRKVRAMVLAEQPLCEDCLAEGRTTPATEVDHVDGDVRNLRRENLRSLCKSCHSRKSVREQGALRGR